MVRVCLELLSEIDFPDMLVFENLLRCTRSDQTAITEYIGSPANSEGFSHIMVGNQDADVSSA
jgi:hypothetical protein